MPLMQQHPNQDVYKRQEYRSGMKVWFTPSLGGKSLQAVSVYLVVDEVDAWRPTW